MASIQDVADFFIASAKGGEPMTNLRLQKMVYYAQAWHLQRHGVPLFDAPVEAWRLGPVVKPLYDAYKQFGDQPITQTHSGYDVINFQTDELETLLDVFHEYNQYTTYALTGRTHRSAEPWSKTPQGEIIPLDRMRKDFDALPPLPSMSDDPHLFDNIPVADALPGWMADDPEMDAFYERTHAEP